MSSSILLLEPFLWDDINDYPDLGSAMLVASLRQAGHDVELVPVQRELLHWLFVSHAPDLIRRIRGQRNASASRYPTLTSLLRKYGPRETAASLERHYYALISTNWGNFLDAARVEQRAALFKEAVQFDFETRIDTADNSLVATWFAQRLQFARPHKYIGISLYRFGTMEVHFAKLVRRLSGDPIIIGGAGTSHMRQEGLEELRRLNVADYLIVGMADRSLPQLLEKLEGHPNRSPDIPGVYDLSLDIPRPIIGITQHAIENLDALPTPDFSMSTIEQYGLPDRVLPLMTSRGCPWRRCVFCAHHKSYANHYDCLSVLRIAQIFREYATKYGCERIVLHDEDLPPDRAMQIAQMIYDEGLSRLRLSAYARPVAGYAKNSIFDNLRRGGFASFSWGVESGSARVLRRMKKGTSTTQVRAILHRAAEQGIGNICWVIVGFPSEQFSDLAATAEMIRKLAGDVDYWMVSSFKLQRDSPLHLDMHSWGIGVADDDDPLRTSFDSFSCDSGPTELELTQGVTEIESALKNTQCRQLPATNRVRLIPFLLRARNASLRRQAVTTTSSSMAVIFGRVQQVNGVSYLVSPIGTIQLQGDELVSLREAFANGTARCPRTLSLVERLGSEGAAIVVDSSTQPTKDTAIPLLLEGDEQGNGRRQGVIRIT